jgi:hypothetical protein
MKHLLSMPKQMLWAHAKKPRNMVRSSVLASANTRLTARQGEGCSTGCGCVVNIKLGCDSTNTVQHAEFTSHRLLLDEQGTALRTAKGRMLMTPCECSVVNGLSSILTVQVRGSSLDSLRNRMLYAYRAPDAAMRTLARNLALQPEKLGCLQVVESALIGALDNGRQVQHTPVELFQDAVEEETDEHEEHHPRLLELDFRDQYA